MERRGKRGRRADVNLNDTPPPPDAADDDDYPLAQRLTPRSARAAARRLLVNNRQLARVRRRREIPRWQLKSVPDQELTMWELCMRNRRELTAEEKRQKREKKDAARIAEERAREERMAMMAEMGPNVDDAVLDLFNSGGVSGGASHGHSTGEFGGTSATAGGQAINDDPFAVGAGGGGGGGDIFDDDVYELTTYQADDRLTLVPYDGAYKHTKATKWTTADTNEFYKQLSVFGTDAMLIQTQMPQYSLQQITTKISKEMKINSDFFAACVAHGCRTTAS